MRTTLDIDEDVLQAARERARREQQSIGRVVSELARRALTAPTEPAVIGEPRAIYGLRPLARRGRVVTNQIIDQLREDDAY